MRVSELHIYPIKSSRGVALETANVELEGLMGDRRWVIINADNRFISQRSHPDLAKLVVSISTTGLHLSFESDVQSVLVPTSDLISLTVWDDTASGQVADEAVNAWLSEKLGEGLRLVHMGPKAGRDHTNSLSGVTVPVSYADGYPILIATQASLDALNDYLGPDESDLPMARFRPNIVVSGTEAWAEDRWARIRVGDVMLEIVKPCTRCIMTTLNPVTGESEGDAAMRAMTALRRSADQRIKGVLFGMNAVPDTLGEIAVDDPVEVLETREAWPIAASKR